MDRTRTLAVSSAFAAALALATAAAQEAAKDDAADGRKAVACYGISLAGDNDCAIAGQNACAGQAGTDFDGQAYRMTAADECLALDGALSPFDGVNPKRKPA